LIFVHEPMLAGLLGLGSRASQIAWRFSREVVLLMLVGAHVAKSAIIHTYTSNPMDDIQK
jgi:hypothetical protein